MNEVAMTTFGPAATQLGCQSYHLELLAKKNLIPFTKAGRYRVVMIADFPAIRQALLRAGYVRNPAPTAAA